MIQKNICIATRLHIANGYEFIFPIFEEWLDYVQKTGVKHIIVAVDARLDKYDSAKKLREMSLKNVHIIDFFSPEGNKGNSVALSAITHKAVALKNNYLLMTSFHQTISTEGINHMASKFTEDIYKVFCVGAKLKIHEDNFYPGKILEGTGNTAPSDVMTMYDLKYLKIAGVPLIVDAAENSEYSENGELTTIAFYRHMFPDDNLVAMVTETPNINTLDSWHDRFSNRENKYTGDGKSGQQQWQLDQLSKNKSFKKVLLILHTK